MLKNPPKSSTVRFNIYYYEHSSLPGQQDGIIVMTDDQWRPAGRSEIHFNSFEEIPAKIRQLLAARDSK